jgi:hypothetical protein
VKALEILETVDELRRKAMERARRMMEEMERKKKEEEMKLKRVLKVRIIRMETRTNGVKGVDEVARKVIMEMLRYWADTCKQEGTLLPWAHHTPLRNSYIHAEIKPVMSDGHNGQFELRIVHFRCFTAHVVFTASLEA